MEYKDDRTLKQLEHLGKVEILFPAMKICEVSGPALKEKQIREVKGVLSVQQPGEFQYWPAAAVSN